MAAYDAEYWRNRAGATYEKINQVDVDDRQKAKLRRVAREYEKLAELAERTRRDNVVNLWRGVKMKPLRKYSA